MPDGARSALLGYLYQLLGTAAITVREVASGADAWADLIARAGQGQVVSEEFGQDATFRPAATPREGVTAIQFKHSDVIGSEIGPDELIDILFAFDRSRRAASDGGVAIDRFSLVTNRRLDAVAVEIVASRDSQAPHRRLKVLAERGGEKVAANVRRLTPYQGNPDRAAAAWHAIVRNLDVFPGETFEADVYRLRDFARRYGVLDREWEGRLDALVGAFVRQTAEGRTISVTPTG